MRSRRLGAGFSPATVWRTLKEQGFGNRRTYPDGVLTETLKEKREAFCAVIEGIDLRSVIAVDETSFYVNTVPRRGWVKRNCRLTVPMQRTTGQRYTLAVALTADGVLSHQLVRGAMNASLFARFIAGLSPRPCHQHVLMDNVAFHKTRMVRDALMARALQPLFTSPYSPDWNPAEMLFSVLKQRRRSKPFQPRDVDAERVVGSALNELPLHFSEAWFTRCWRHIKARHHP
jgi:transposase